MRYKVVGYVVWQGGKWYLRRRFRGTGRKLVIAGAAGLALGGGVVAFAAVRRAQRA